MKGAAFHLAILRSAAVLVPGTQRADWLAEWRSELWHVRRDPHGLNITAFCLGAFQDAFWLWRDDPCPDGYRFSAESPFRCLSLLAALGALCFVVALLLPAARILLLNSLYSRDLVMLTPADRGDPGVQNGFLDPYPTVSRKKFESLKSLDGPQFSGLAFYAPAYLPVQTPNGNRTLLVARTTARLFRLLNIPVGRGNSGTPGLVLTSVAWRKYFQGDSRFAGRDVIAGSRWLLPGRVDAWLIEDDADLAAMPAYTEGYVIGRLRYDALRDSQFLFVRLRDRSLVLFWVPAVGFLLGYALLRVMPSDSRGGPLRRIGPRRGLFLAAKNLLILPIVLFGSLDLTSLGDSMSPLFLQVAVFASLFAVRWINSDQRGRCPVCLRLLANPVRIGEPGRIFLAWHGTELMCRRGHGLLYEQDWPALWSGRQRWMDLGASWAKLFPARNRNRRIYSRI